MQFISGDLEGGKRVNSKDFCLSFRCTKPTHPGCVKDVSLTQAQFPPGTPPYPHLPKKRMFRLEQRLNKVSWQHQQLLEHRGGCSGCSQLLAHGKSHTRSCRDLPKSSSWSRHRQCYVMADLHPGELTRLEKAGE